MSTAPFEDSAQSAILKHPKARARLRTPQPRHNSLQACREPHDLASGRPEDETFPLSKPGPWVSIFGLNIDQHGPHLPEGTPWKTWDEGSGTIDLTGTKPNHQYICYIKGNVCPGGVDPDPAGAMSR